jgi:hypothetical protein
MKFATSIVVIIYDNQYLKVSNMCYYYKMVIKTRNRKDWKEMARVGIIAGAIALTFGGISYYNKISSSEKIKQETYLDITPEVGTKLSMHMAMSVGTGIVRSVYDKDNHRLLVFYDHGYDGSLDTVRIDGANGEGEKIIEDRVQLKEWSNIYQELNELRSGEYACPWKPRHYRNKNIQYVNKLERSLEK